MVFVVGVTHDRVGGAGGANDADRAGPTMQRRYAVSFVVVSDKDDGRAGLGGGGQDGQEAAHRLVLVGVHPIGQVGSENVDDNHGSGGPLDEHGQV
jgi:hypothetical protein